MIKRAAKAMILRTAALGVCAIVFALAPAQADDAAPSVKNQKANERSLLYMPNEGDFRFQEIAKGPNEAAWPFSVSNGFLSCAWVMGAMMINFQPIPSENCNCDDDAGENANLDDAAAVQPVVVLSANPLELIFLNIEHRSLFAPYKDVAELINRVSPYYAMGRRLCEQPQGTFLPGAEL